MKSGGAHVSTSCYLNPLQPPVCVFVRDVIRLKASDRLTDLLTERFIELHFQLKTVTIIYKGYKKLEKLNFTLPKPK